VLELTRDARTVFVSQLQVRATADDIEDFFGQVGRVAGVSLIRDKHTGRSKGFAYVEFEDIESVAHALILNGQKFCLKHPGCVCSGFPVAVKPSEAEKNYAAQAEASGGSTLTAGIEKRVYLCGLAPTVSEGDVRRIAEVIGPVDKVSVVRDGGGRSRGYAFIVYTTVEAANRGMRDMHALAIAGREVKAGKLNALGMVVAHTGETFPLEGGAGGGGGGGGAGGGVGASSGAPAALTAQARAALIAQLSSATTVAVQQLGAAVAAVAAASASAATAAAAQAPPPLLVPPALAGLPPTPCIRLQNLFSPAEETEAGWEADIREEVGEELVTCGGGGPGSVLHLHVDPVHPDGVVWAMLADVPSAARAVAALAGRKFGGRVIAAEFVGLPDYLTRFPESAALGQ
jgi:RNA-binding protein 23/39